MHVQQLYAHAPASGHACMSPGMRGVPRGGWQCACMGGGRASKPGWRSSAPQGRLRAFRCMHEQRACVHAHLDVVEALHKADDSAFAAAALAHKRGRFAGACMQAEAAEHLHSWPRGVRKRHLLQHNLAGHLAAGPQPIRLAGIDARRAVDHCMRGGGSPHAWCEVARCRASEVL
jgi:hypothetical protein